jgi:hypothetical protein
LFRYGIAESKSCPVCDSENEDLFHMFLQCQKFSDFKNNFVIYNLESLLKDCENSSYNLLNF